MGEIHELFVLALSLVWFAGATPEITDILIARAPAERAVFGVVIPIIAIADLEFSDRCPIALCSSTAIVNIRTDLAIRAFAIAIAISIKRSGALRLRKANIEASLRFT